MRTIPVRYLKRTPIHIPLSRTGRKPPLPVMPLSSPSSFARLPLELILHIAHFIDDNSLRALRATSSGILELLNPMAFRTFLIRLRSVGFRKRIAPLKHNDMTLVHQRNQGRVSHDLLSYIQVCRIEMGDATVHQGMCTFTVAVLVN
jgi:hypothetical protein